MAKANIDRKRIDWDRIIERNIISKSEVIFEAMEWDFRKINPTHVGTIYIKPDKKTKDEVTRFLAQEEK